MRTATMLLAVVVVLVAAPAWAADLEAGWRAYAQGDYATALKEWRPLAKQGDADAQHNLGVIYRDGQGIPQDYKEAVRWYRLAADQGYAKAQSNLGLMYEYGEGVPQDDVQARMWLNLAAAQGNELARINRDRLTQQMTPVQLAEAQRLAREWTPKGK